jgi:SAM-dependent methyltransferase
MAENNRGLRAVLQRPQVYLGLQRALGVRKLNRYLIDRYVRPRPDLRLLDIGCGPGTLLYSLPPVRYHGFDLNADYISFAQRRFGQNDERQFRCQRVGEEQLTETDRYDVVLAVGLLHHLDDDEARHLCQLARARLAPGGRFLTVDPCFVDGQNPLARLVISRDRGRNVRRPDEYRALTDAIFPQVTLEVKHGLLHIPYTHAIMSMSRPASPPS